MKSNDLPDMWVQMEQIRRYYRELGAAKHEALEAMDLVGLFAKLREEIDELELEAIDFYREDVQFDVERGKRFGEELGDVIYFLQAIQSRQGMAPDQLARAQLMKAFPGFHVLPTGSQSRSKSPQGADNGA